MGASYIISKLPNFLLPISFTFRKRIYLSPPAILRLANQPPKRTGRGPTLLDQEKKKRKDYPVLGRKPRGPELGNRVQSVQSVGRLMDTDKSEKRV